MTSLDHIATMAARYEALIDRLDVRAAEYRAEAEAMAGKADPDNGDEDFWEVTSNERIAAADELDRILDEARTGTAGRIEYVTVTELQVGDLIDLEGDGYARDDADADIWAFEYAVVDEVYRHSAECFRVTFSNGWDVGFPTDHRVKRVRDEA